MEFLSGREKILELRKKLNLKQKDFESENFTRGYLGLLENGKRNITEEAAKIITKRFKERAEELGIELELEESYFLRDIREEAEIYCIKKLSQQLTVEEIEEIVEIADRYEIYSVKSKAYSNMGDYYYKSREYMHAFKNFFYALDLLKNNEPSSEKCYIYNCLGMCKYMLLNYSEAIIYFNKARNDGFILDEEGMTKKAIYNLALCNKKLLNYQEALNLIDIVIADCDKDKNLYQYIHANTFKANCYEEMEKLDEGIIIYQNIISLIDADKSEILGYLYNNLAGMLLKKNNYAEALSCYNKSQFIRNKVDRKNLSHTLIEKSAIYVAKGLYNEAIMIIELGIEEAKNQNDYEYILKGYEALQQIYEKLEMQDECKAVLKELIGMLGNEKNILLQLKYYNILLGVYLKQEKYDKVMECQKEIVELLT